MMECALGLFARVGAVVRVLGTDFIGKDEGAIPPVHKTHRQLYVATVPKITLIQYTLSV